MEASHNGCYNIAKLLIEKNANINVKTNQRLTALTITKERSHDNIANLLIERGDV